jgi:two-component system phosphate regulon sensor histidine kinase PhoR
MSSRSYKIIFALLSFSALSILGVQAYWMRNYYLQKSEEFQRNVYSALDHINNKLNEKKNLRTVKEQVLTDRVEVYTAGKSSKKPGRKVNIEKNQVISHNSDSAVIYSTTGPEEDIVIEDIRMDSGNSKTGHYKVKLSKKPQQELSIINSDSARARLKVLIEQLPSEEKTKMQRAAGKKDLERLMDKMLMEIKVIDTSERNADTLHALIERALESKGIFIAFEFALKKIFQGKEEILVRSPGFRNREKTFMSDLSANNVFPTHEFLFLNFPGENRLVFASMRNMMMLSLVFTFFITGLFYFVIHVIRQQKKITEIRNDFVNNMTHELKTPIATISLGIDAIRNPLVKNNQAMFSEYSRIMKEETQKLNSHVERVLQMSLIEKGKLHLDKRSTDIVALMESVIKMYALLAKEKNASVIFEAPEIPITINADEDHLRSVLSNLLDNALKYSDENCRIVIEIKDNHGEVWIKISDNGIGIKKEQQ